MRKPSESLSEEALPEEEEAEEELRITISRGAFVVRGRLASKLVLLLGGTKAPPPPSRPKRVDTQTIATLAGYAAEAWRSLYKRNPGLRECASPPA